ncbi:hypothetical protein T440DRAFT_522501 [Plenodomus tracheiphilus IPT5]|uniref:Uncharacterized protein n=1 Tax=Plenodomus tracheiphilus IPT5 TaxID=1408161 RepID=A0A6A7AQP6_9PLEO|nr:hypothetical protein T440DRAFT_522501 [Plenodomus tracheiphilus IPT5]
MPPRKSPPIPSTGTTIHHSPYGDTHAHNTDTMMAVHAQNLLSHGTITPAMAAELSKPRRFTAEHKFRAKKRYEAAQKLLADWKAGKVDEWENPRQTSTEVHNNIRKTLKCKQSAELNKVKRVVCKRVKPFLGYFTQSPTNVEPRSLSDNSTTQLSVHTGTRFATLNGNED